MPQMFPLLWLSLFISTNLLLMFMMSLIYFSTKIQPQTKALNHPVSSISLNWKW